MGRYVADRVMKLMTQRRTGGVGSRVLVLGATFKENCPDLRNSQVGSIIRELVSCNARVDIHDPWVDDDAVRSEFGVDSVSRPDDKGYDALILAVGNDEFRERGSIGLRQWLRDPGVLYDVKAILPAEESDERL